MQTTMVWLGFIKVKVYTATGIGVHGAEVCVMTKDAFFKAQSGGRGDDAGTKAAIAGATHTCTEEGVPGGAQTLVAADSGMLSSESISYNARAGGFLISPLNKNGVIRLTFDDSTTWRSCDVSSEAARADPAQCAERIEVYDGPDDTARRVAVSHQLLVLGSWVGVRHPLRHS